MQSLERRIAALEAASPCANLFKTIFVTFLMPGDAGPDIRKLRQSGIGDSGTEWERGADESEKDFKDRASREAARKAGFAVLVQSD